MLMALLSGVQPSDAIGAIGIISEQGNYLLVEANESLLGCRVPQYLRSAALQACLKYKEENLSLRDRF